MSDIPAAVPKKKPVPKRDRPISSNVRLIAIDTKVKELLEWDKAGDRFQFDFDNFKELDTKTLAELSKFNREGYFISKAVADKVKEKREAQERGEGPTPGLVVPSVRDKLELNVLGGGASGRTKIKDGRPGTHYCLKRMDEMEESLDLGYSFVDSEDPVKTPGMTKVGGTRRISRGGVDEMILMKIPEERYKKHLHAVSEIGRGNVENARDGFHEAGSEFKKKYHLEYADNTKRVKAPEEK